MKDVEMGKEKSKGKGKSKVKGKAKNKAGYRRIDPKTGKVEGYIPSKPPTDDDHYREA
jgi:hypothetical protein